MNWGLIGLLVLILGLFGAGLYFALQTPNGRKRLGDAALALAEKLLTYAVRWLEGGAVDVPTIAGHSRAQRALDVLNGE